MRLSESRVKTTKYDSGRRLKRYRYTATKRSQGHKTLGVYRKHNGLSIDHCTYLFSSCYPSYPLVYSHANKRETCSTSNSHCPQPPRVSDTSAFLTTDVPTSIKDTRLPPNGAFPMASFR